MLLTHGCLSWSDSRVVRVHRVVKVGSYLYSRKEEPSPMAPVGVSPPIGLTNYGKVQPLGLLCAECSLANFNCTEVVIVLRGCELLGPGSNAGDDTRPVLKGREPDLSTEVVSSYSKRSAPTPRSRPMSVDSSPAVAWLDALGERAPPALTDCVTPSWRYVFHNQSVPSPVSPGSSSPISSLSSSTRRRGPSPCPHPIPRWRATHSTN